GSFFDWAAKDDMGPPLLLSAVAAPVPASGQFEDVSAEPVGIVAQVGIGTVQQQIVGNHMTPQILETIDIRKNGVRPFRSILLLDCRRRYRVVDNHRVKKAVPDMIVN